MVLEQLRKKKKMLNFERQNTDKIAIASRILDDNNLRVIQRKLLRYNFN